VSGQDLTWFFDEVHRRSVMFDYGVAQVSSTPVGPRGRVGEGSAASFEAGGGAELDHLVVVRRYGDGVFPIDIRITFDDGTRVNETWDGGTRWRAFEYRRAGRVATVEVDPDRVLLLDLDYTNNSWTAEPRAAEAGWKWTLRWLTWFEEVLLTYALFS
jgi:hypothetical protein